MKCRLSFFLLAVGEFVGFMGATLNPYSVGIAQTISGVELYSGTGYRAICFVIFMAISIIYVMVYGRKIKKNPGLSIRKILRFIKIRYCVYLVFLF